ncbi:MAG TPA: hypothetical protein VHL80_20790 [Polyangia bacterium]|nr:hypothetical protein [Polyangia bacterium]
MPGWLGKLKTSLIAFGKSGGLWLGLALSIGLAIVSLAIATAVVVTWPADRFKPGAAAAFLATHHTAVRVVAHVGKNVAGVILVLLGIIMALPGVPGQGILTMIIGLTLVDFPGKLNLERRLIARPFVLHKLNALRQRFKRPALELD